MALYRKKPVVIEAVKFNGVGMDYPTFDEQPGWLTEALMGGRVEPQVHGGGWAIKTLEGEMTAVPGDYIIRGVKGELYPCKPDIFAATYDLVEA